MTTIQFAATVIAALLGGGLFGGLGAYIRARGQNRNDAQIALTNEQQQFRLSMAAEIAELRTEIRHLKESNAALDVRNDQLVKENAELTGRVRYLEEQNADLKNRLMNADVEKDAMKREMAQLRQHITGMERRKIEGATV